MHRVAALVRARHARPGQKLSGARGGRIAPRAPDRRATPGPAAPPLKCDSWPCFLAGKKGREKKSARPGVVAVWCAGRRFAGGW
jgi:hypothetical protein